MNIYVMKSTIFENKITKTISEIIMDFMDVISYFFRKSYTQNKEDLLIKKLLIQNNKKIKDIKYIDIGANKWRHGNNSFLLYKAGAKGVLIEADPELAVNLEKKRPRDQVANIAIDLEKKSSVNFYVLSLPTRSSLDEVHIKKQLEKGIKLVKTIKIPAVTINETIIKYGVPDVLSVDIEGLDYEVLKTIDYSKYKIHIIIAEKDTEKCEDMDKFMESKNYSVYSKTNANVIYVLDDNT